jgi:hypothetical protein
MGGDDEVGSPLIQPEDGVVCGDAAAHLHAPGHALSASRAAISLSGPKHDNVTAAEIIPTIHAGIMGGRKLGGKIGLQGGLITGQSRADNLFYSALMQIYAGSEAHNAIPKIRGSR